MAQFPTLTLEQRQRLAAILHEVQRRAAAIRARRLGGCSLAATDDVAGLPDRDDVVAASEEPLSVIKEHERGVQ